ncbi:GH18428 [Drosophila grimshawi]|uniref:Aminopeptidase n=2 Tax=Drosophila grimshawi TaxID=7222 RepID=B4JEL8_DROGR|nr:GH18428 [Drosophila grimshawi]
MIITAKLVSICLGVALTAFTISTIVLAVQKANLQDDLRDAREKLDLLEGGFTSTTALPSSTPTTTGPGTGTTESPPEKINYRLPTALTPTNYDLTLHPNIDTGTFSGDVIIYITVNEPTDQIILHSLYLDIKSVVVYETGESSVIVENFTFDTVREFMIINLNTKLTVGSLVHLYIEFSGNMANKIVGLYSSSYLKADETRKTIATSKFEPTYARQAFPCFDEPALKATFEIKLVRPTGGNYHALSNMNVDVEVDEGATTDVLFAKSVPMSTYLACFIISDFQAKTVKIDTKGIGKTFDMGVYATPEQIDKVDFAVNVGKGVIEYYIDYFQIEYPLPKLDMAAIPDFVSGAMEHWGLVTFRETSLLYEVATSSTVNKQRIASVIAHEFAHMWFGNLVTMQWWNDLWLNEGFASFIEYLGVDSVYPEWQMRDQFIVSTLHGVFSLDGTLGSHPIIQKVENPDQITEIFDTITYSKGSSLVRMLEDFLGEPIFRQAVTNYLNEYKYKNAVTADFFNEIDKLDLEYNVTDIMLTWTVQMGLPVVTIEKLSDTEYKLKQKRFLSNPNDYNEGHEPSEFDYRWSIPITYTTSANPQVQRDWFYYDYGEMIIKLPAAVQWIKFNHDQVGYYRVNYDQALWQSLANQMVAKPDAFSAGDRASILNDAFALADATQLPYEVAFDMTKYLDKEVNYVPWSVAASKLTSLKRTLYYTSTFVKYKKYATALIEPIYTSLTWTVGEDHLDNRLRVTALGAACSLGLDACLTEGGQQFKIWLATPDKRPSPDVRETVYYYGMQSVGNQEIWEAVWELFISETDASEKSKLMYGLSAIQEPWLLQRYIDLAWNEEYVRGQDYFSCLTYISSNPMGESLVWDYVRENWMQLVARFGLNERYLGNLIPSITARFHTQTKLEEMEHFFAKYPEAGAGTAARVRALETVKNNIVWLAENLESVDAWLDKQDKQLS